MANELKITVRFDTGQATKQTKEYAEGSIGALRKSLREANEELNRMAKGSQEAVNQLAKVKMMQADLNDALGRGIVAYKNTTGASANAAMTMQALNYTIRDSPYFFRDFSLGLMAIGNNLNPLIDGLIRMRIEAGGGGRALSFLQNNITGITLVFSLAVSAIQAITFALSKNKEEVKKTANEVERLNSAYSKYTKDTLQRQIDMKDIELQLLEKQGLKPTYDIFGKEVDIGLAKYTDQEKAKQLLSEKAILDRVLFTTNELSDAERRLAENRAKLGKITIENYNAFVPMSAISKDIMQRYKDEEKFGGLRERNFLRAKAQLDEWVKIDEKITQNQKNNAEKLVSSFDLSLDELDAKIEDFKNRIEANETLRKLFLDIEKAQAPEWMKKRLDLLDDYADKLNKIVEVEKVLGYQQEARVRLLESSLKSLSLLTGEPDITGLSGKTMRDRRSEMEKEQSDYVSGDLNMALDEIIKKQQDIKSLATTIGNDIYQAFIQGKKGVDEFVASLAAAALQFVFMQALTFGFGSAFGAKGLSTIFGTVKRETLPTVPTIQNIPQIQNAGVSQRLNAINGNIAGMQEPTIIIQADTDAIRFTRKKVNPSQTKLRRGNIGV